MGFMKFDAIPEAKYLCDTIEDLSILLPRPSYGDTCWVISEACEYICNSKGEWLPKEKASKTTANVDLTGYATEDFVQEQIQNIEHPVVEVPSKLSELENDVNYAQQAYVDTKVADLVNSAPETLDTIGEIAQALKEHQDVADAITEAIGKKADKEDLPSIEGLASEAFVTEAIQQIEFPVTDLSNYYTRDEVTQAIVDNAELPEGGLAHQYLVVDANGNKTWETQTHYLEERIVTNVAETTGTGRYIPYYVTHGLKLGKEYTIIHNGVEYKCTSVEFSGDVILGNLGMGGIPGATDTGEPFVFLGSKTDNVYVQYAIFKDNIEHTFSIEGPSDIATQLSDKFIPPTVPKTTFGDVGDTVVITEAHHGAPVKWTATKLPKKLSDLENDIKFIDQEYVDIKVAELVDNAPETLNTLKEVADALNENASTVEALNQAIGNKVNKTDYPITANPNQVLATNNNGEKAWEEKLAYTTAETIPFLEEFTWDGTQTSFPTAIADANDGDAVTIYIDDIPYTGVLQDDFFTSWLVKFDEEYDNSWIKAMDQFHISKKGYNMNIGGAPLTWAVGKLSATVSTDVVHPIDNKYLGLKIKNGSEENSMIINGDEGATGYGALSINNGRASGTYSVALGNSSASGLYSFAATGGSAKAENSAAFGDWTDAVTNNSVTIGTHNITDENKEYLFIVGNGEKGEFNPQTGYQRTLSNAHTVNKDGTGWFQKEIKVGGASEHDENAKTVATEEYVNSLLENKADSADIVQANWDENSSESNAYVMNRPFYDSRTNVIEWDGETSDTIVTIPAMGVTLYRVSDTPLTKAELGTVTYYSFGGTKGYTNLNSDLLIEGDGKIICESQSFTFMSVLEDGATLHVGAGMEDVIFEKKGIYFWELKFSATSSLKTQKIKYGAVTQIPDYYISDKIARQDTVRWIDYSTPKTFMIYAAHLDQDVITEVHPSGYIAGTGKNYTNNLSDALSYDDLQKYFSYAPNWAKVVNIAWHPSEDVLEKRQAIDLHMGNDGISFHFIKDITFDETTGQPKFNLKKVWIANPNYVAE